MSGTLDDIAVEKFKSYLRIKSAHVCVLSLFVLAITLRFRCVQPTADYESCVTFLTAYASEIGLPIERIDV